MNDIAWYGIYGETGGGEEPGFFHIERMSDRARLLQGRAVPHAHRNLFQVMFAALGNCLLEVDNRRHELTAPCAVYIPSGAVHSITFDDSESVGWVLTAADSWLDALRNDPAALQLTLEQPVIVRLQTGTAGPAELNWVLERLEREQQERAPAQVLMIQNLVALLLLTLLRQTPLHAADQPGAAHSDRVLFQRFRDLLENHFRDRWTVDQFAAAMGVTRATLNRLTERQAGRSVHEMVQHRVLLEAQRLLIYTSASAVQIAAELGFQDPAYFSRFFKRQTGATPLAFRRERGH